MDKPASAAEFAHLPPTLRAERQGAVAVLKLARPEKRNALDDATVLGIEAFFSSIPDGIGAVVLAGDGDNFSAGLDLAELTERDVTAGIEHSRFWHRVFEKIEFGKIEPGAEIVAVAGQHHGADAVRDRGKERLDTEHGRVVERIALVRTRELEHGDRALSFGAQRRRQRSEFGG